MEKKKWNTFFFLFLYYLSLCDLEKGTRHARKITYFIGIDVSGSFSKTAAFKDSLQFLSHYIHAHLNEKGGLNPFKDLYVGGIGGDQKEEPQAFFPIHDFKNKTSKAIHEKLVKEFANQKDSLTDFNTLFERVATLAKQKKLTLAPITLILISDGVPEILKGKVNKKIRF